MKRNDGNGASVKKIKVPDEVNGEGNVTGESGKCGGRRKVISSWATRDERDDSQD